MADWIVQCAYDGLWDRVRMSDKHREVLEAHKPDTRSGRCSCNCKRLWIYCPQVHKLGMEIFNGDIPVQH